MEGENTNKLLLYSKEVNLKAKIAKHALEAL
jgi:hypothetical protein